MRTGLIGTCTVAAKTTVIKPIPLRSSPFVRLHHGLKVFCKSSVASNEPLDLVTAERAHRQPDLQRPELASKGHLLASTFVQ